MISLNLVILLFVTHFVADFLLQSDWMALNKSKSWDALLSHTAVYSLCFLPFGLLFALVTFVLHTLTDAVTSRITSRLWFIELTPSKGLHTTSADGWYRIVPNYRHWFFVAIGFDQLIHTVTLLWCLKHLSVL